MNKVELFEFIRRDRMIHGKSIREISRERGVHRRVVRQALASALPPQRSTGRRARPKLTDEHRSQADSWLKGDRKAPRKQRHTARRIYHRLRDEHGYAGSESTVRRYVGNRRRELGVSRAVFIVQCHQPGEEAEVDWYEICVDFPSGRRKVQMFQMRACYSGREFHMAFPNQRQQAFLEGFVAAFSYFGGVFSRVRLDNLRLAVVKILRGRRRAETDRFVSLRSHYLFSAEYCQPGLQGAHEKGGVEGGVGRFRRNHLVPVPEVSSIAELNRYLLTCCSRDDARRIEGHQWTVGEMWKEEVGELRELPTEPFGTAEVRTGKVDNKSRVKAYLNWYSVPIRFANRQVEVRVHANQVEIFHGGQCVARHERLHGRHEHRLELDHYLELLKVKPGALQGSLAFHQQRRSGEWSASYDAYWRILRQREESESEASIKMVELLLLRREATALELEKAVTLAVKQGWVSVDGIKLSLRQQRSPEQSPSPLSHLGQLDRYERAADTDLSPYDQLLVGAGQVQT